MPKGKRKQNKQHGDDGDDDDSCRHIKSPANHLEKMLENKSLKGCEDCQSGRKKAKAHGGKPPRADDLWVCLTCGTVTCGTSTPQFHCRQHYAYYNKHFVVVNLKSLEVKCFECALTIKVDDSDKYKELRQCLNVIKKAKGLEVEDEAEDDAKENKTENDSHNDQRGKNNKQNQKNQGKKGRQQQQHAQSRKGKQSLNEDIELVLANEVAHLDISNDMTSGIKGLKNLGNTCFFNSIMQNLAHTIPLREKVFQLMGPIREEMKTLEKPTPNNDNTKKEEKSTSESETASTSSNESNNSNNSNNNTNEETKTTSNETSSAGSVTEQNNTTSETKAEETNSSEQKKPEMETKPAVNNNNVLAQPLEGPLTKSFKDFMVNMWHGKGSVFSPQSLFLQIKKKAPRFSTMRQQDAQELLRYLLDGLSSEERIVFQVEAAKREMANFPSLDKLSKEQQLELKSILAKVKAKPPPSLIEQLFEGQLESTITCHHCGHKSRVIEPILDLSLSLESPKKGGAAMQEESVTLNKKQRQKLLREKQFKEKQAEELKKQEEEAKKKQEEAQNNQSSEDSTAAEAPKVDTDGKPASSHEATPAGTDTKNDDVPKDQNEGAEKSDATTEVHVPENTSSEPSTTDDKKEESATSSTETKDAEIKPAEEVKDHTKTEKESTDSGKNEKTSAKKTHKGKDKNEKVEPKNDWDDLPEDTVPPMMNQVDGRHVKEVPTGCSIQSTIYAFTAPELLERDNAFSCYNCTKLHWMKHHKNLTSLILAHGDPPEIEEIKKKLEQQGEEKKEEVKVETSSENENKAEGSNTQANPFDALKTDSENKMDTEEEEDDEKDEEKPQKEGAKPAPKPKIPLLRRTATKQFLFKKQPDILTLHIKRFMQTNNGFQKISTHVEYPAILDLTPFLSETCMEQEKRYKYKLYGIVSHSGGLNSGHYVAYVRNRRVNETLEDAINAGWHYFSDTQFHELRFEEVLRKEAYMLFYERFEDSSVEDKSSDL